MKILLLDDDQMILDVMQMVMGDYGYDVEGCQTYLQAKQRISEENYCFIITDLDLSARLNGANFVSRVRSQLGDHIPVLVATGNSRNAEITQMALVCGADGFVQKPYSREDLLRAMQKVATVKLQVADNPVSEDLRKLLYKVEADIAKIDEDAAQADIDKQNSSS